MTQHTPGKVECQNCGMHKKSEVKVTFPDIPDLLERIAPGEPVPFGECPHCGCLVHEVTRESLLRDSAEDLLAALEGMILAAGLPDRPEYRIAEDAARAAIAKAKA